MAVIGREKQDRMFKDVRIGPWLRAAIVMQSSVANGARKAARGDASGLLKVMCDPNEWKCAGIYALVTFVALLALGPALTPDQKKLAAGINHQTLKAAAEIKSSTR